MHGFSGAVASFITRTLMNPIGAYKHRIMCGVSLMDRTDIAKTRLQTQDIYSVGDPTHRSTLGVLMHMLRTEGLRSAFKGLVPALMSSVPAGIAVRLLIQTYIHTDVTRTKRGHRRTLQACLPLTVHNYL